MGVLARFGAVCIDGQQEAMSVALTPLGRRGMRRALGEQEPGAPVLQVKITLLETAEPVVWRRLLVPADIRLDRLHTVIQAAMGWQDYHLHCFTHGDTRYSLPDRELGFRDERAVTLGKLLTSERDRIGYTYDFGDGWEHELVLERVGGAEPDTRYPVCVAGGGACPPEDCGGVFGYEQLREVLADESNAEHESMLQWLGLTTMAEFDPARFDVNAANQALAGIGATIGSAR